MLEQGSRVRRRELSPSDKATKSGAPRNVSIELDDGDEDGESDDKGIAQQRGAELACWSLNMQPPGHAQYIALRSPVSV
jgi:hypothetical protein